MEKLGFSKYRLIYLLLVVLSIHLISYSYLGLPFSFLIFGVGLALLFYDIGKGISFYFLAILLFDDINKYDIDIPPLKSIFTVDLIGMSISLLWSVIVLFAMCVYFISNKRLRQPVAFPLGVVVLFFFLGLARIFQFGNPAFISDVGFVVNILTGYLVGSILLISDLKIRYYFAVILSVFLSKYIVITVHGIYASAIGVFYTLKGESASNFIIVPLVFILLVLFNKRIQLKRTSQLFFVIFFLFLLSYLFITISRERILISILAILFFLIVYKKAQVAIYMALISVVIVLMASRFNPNMYSFISWKLATFLPKSEGKVNASSSVRLVEFNNILQEQLSSPYKLLVGTGWGGYYTSNHTPFTNEMLGDSSYPEEWIENDTFFRPHGTYLYVLLKYGTLGLVLFYGSLLIYCIRNLFNRAIYKTSGREGIWVLRYIQIALSLSLPLVSLVIFTSKLQILSGFLVAMIFYARKEIDNSVNFGSSSGHKFSSESLKQ